MAIFSLKHWSTVPDYFEEIGIYTLRKMKIIFLQTKCQRSFPNLCLDFFTEKYPRIYYKALYIEEDQRLNSHGNMELGDAPGGTRQ